MSDSAIVNILGIPVHDVTTAETLDWFGRMVVEGGTHQICTVNPEFIIAAQRDVEFKQILNRSALNLPDGIGVLWAARRLGRPLRERVAGSDLIYAIARQAAATGWRIFLLGAADGVAEQAAQTLCTRYPGLKIAGAWAGSPAPEFDDDLIARIQPTSPDIVLVAYGAPKQDKWLARNLKRTGAAIGMGIGGSLDFVAGTQKRAPRWLQRFGLEWLYRLMREPRRWRRQMALPRFVWRVWMDGKRRGQRKR
jgi:N-acetylglucosaminyldiphosphoundecaprenol N-acetyl-beta-D-mannosaminyltransferase